MARSFEEDEKNRKPRQSASKEGTSSSCSSVIMEEVLPLPTPDTATASGSQGNDQPQLQLIDEDVVEEGRHLYLDFVRTEMNRSGLHDDCIDEADRGVNPQKMLEWLRAGRELRHLADAFARSRERDEVRRRASNVSVETLDMDRFMHLLQELFQNGTITRERVIVLFFFCADVAIQALRKGLHQTFHRLLDWSLRYIATQVASWVHSHGGWSAVLQSGLNIAYQVTACCAFVAVVFACAVYIRRNL